MRIFVLALFLPLFALGCSSQPKELKSPCVGAEGSPCAKRPANPDRYVI